MNRTVRTVTVLFATVVDPPDPSERLGAATAEELRGRYIAGMRGALAVHGGSEVKTGGEGFRAIFDSATEGLACAVTMQRSFARRNGRRPDRTIGLCIGLSAGEAAYDDGECAGAPVLEANRLCAAAGPGQVLVADIIRLLVGGWRHPLRPLRELAACEVDWEADEDAALRVALADDSVLLREGLARVLEAEGVDVVLQASDADALLEGLVATRPDVAVVDVRMPPTHTIEGIRAAEHIRAEYPEIGVLVLSQALEPGAARRLLHGAPEGVGYMLKERVADVRELMTAIHTVANRGSAIDPEMLARMG